MNIKFAFVLALFCYHGHSFGQNDPFYWNDIDSTNYKEILYSAKNLSPKLDEKFSGHNSSDVISIFGQPGGMVRENGEITYQYHLNSKENQHNYSLAILELIFDEKHQYQYGRVITRSMRKL